MCNFLKKNTVFFVILMHLMIQVKKALNAPLSAVKTFRPRLRGSRWHNWIRRRLTSHAWTSSDPLGCTLRLCLIPLHRAICTRAIGKCIAASAAVTSGPVYTCHSYRITHHYLSNLQRHFVIYSSTNFKSLHLPRCYNGFRHNR